jgi:hypothetical protein
VALLKNLTNNHELPVNGLQIGAKLMSIGAWRLSRNVVVKMCTIPDYYIVAVDRLSIAEAIKFCFIRRPSGNRPEISHI